MEIQAQGYMPGSRHGCKDLKSIVVTEFEDAELGKVVWLDGQGARSGRYFGFRLTLSAMDDLAGQWLERRGYIVMKGD